MVSARRLSGAVWWTGLLAAMAALVVGLGPAPTAPGPASRDRTGVQLVRFGGRGFSLGSRPTFSRPVNRFGGRTPSRSRGILRRIGHALALAALFHFLFAGSGGLGFLVLLVVVVGLFVLASRRRRRRAYPGW
jgi:hypothetical protein